MPARAGAPSWRKFPGVELVNDSFFNEFTLLLPIEARPVVHTLAERDMLGGVSLGRLYPGNAALGERPGRRGHRNGDRRGYCGLCRGAEGGAGMTALNPTGWRPEMTAAAMPTTTRPSPATAR